MADDMVTIYIMGKAYEVPENLTIMKAMEYSGFQLKRGCGCRGGFCGACATVYRIKGDYRVQEGLACQTVVQEDMYLSMIPFYPAIKKDYDLEEISPQPNILMQLYPEINRCLGCNTCTRSCPQDLEVMNYMSAAIRGDVERVANLSFDCIMCGLCASRCPAELVQHNVGILARRIYGKYIAPKADHLQERINELQEGKWESEVEELMEKDREELEKLYNQRDIEEE